MGSRKITHNFDASMIFVFGLKLPKQKVQSCVIFLLLSFDDIKTKACTNQKTRIKMRPLRTFEKKHDKKRGGDIH